MIKGAFPIAERSVVKMKQNDFKRLTFQANGQPEICLGKHVS